MRNYQVKLKKKIICKNPYRSNSNECRWDAASLCVDSQAVAVTLLSGGLRWRCRWAGGVTDDRVNTHCWCYLLVHLCCSGPQWRLPGPAGCPERSESSWHWRWSWLWCLLLGKGGRRGREGRRVGRRGIRTGRKETDLLYRNLTNLKVPPPAEAFLLNIH